MSVVVASVETQSDNDSSTSSNNSPTHTNSSSFNIHHLNNGISNGNRFRRESLGSTGSASSSSLSKMTSNVSSPHSISLNCRMYEELYPSVESLVVVQIKSVVEMGAYCSLLEYNNIEGMILMSELSRHRVRSVRKIIKVGKQEIVSVMRVNKEKGYIDLSKKRVSSVEVKKAEERWNKSKAVHSIFRHCAKKLNYSVEYLYNRIGWPITHMINPQTNKRFEHIYDGFKYAIDNKDKFLSFSEWNNGNTIDCKLIDMLFLQIDHRFRKKSLEIRASIECTCFSKEGILAIKYALKEGQLYGSDDEVVISIKLVKSPLYLIHGSTCKAQIGIDRINDMIDKIESILKSKGGTVVRKEQPFVVNEHNNDDSHNSPNTSNNNTNNTNGEGSRTINEAKNDGNKSVLKSNEKGED